MSTLEQRIKNLQAVLHQMDNELRPLLVERLEQLTRRKRWVEMVEANDAEIARLTNDRNKIQQWLEKDIESENYDKPLL